MRPIDADAIIAVMDKCAETPEDAVAKLCYSYTSRILKDAPTIDAVPVRHGEWKYNPKDAIEMMFALPKCSICGHESSDALNYCPNCGARMDGERREG